MVADELAQEMMDSMPEAELTQAGGITAYMVRNRKFGVLIRGYVRLRVGDEDRRMLLASSKAKFSMSPRDGRGGWVTVRLQMVNAQELRELVVKAWRNTAPITLANSY